LRSIPTRSYGNVKRSKEEPNFPARRSATSSKLSNNNDKPLSLAKYKPTTVSS
jgi:hypothetical protein